MTDENQTAIELSNEELDVVAGGVDFAVDFPEFEIPNIPAIAVPQFFPFPGQDTAFS
jgi:hypothetical protein